MTTQSDREKAEKFAEAFDLTDEDFHLSVEAYIAGAQSKDREWQAKVQGLIETVQWSLRQDWSYENHGPPKVPEKLSNALTQFTSGQPAQGVMSDEDFMREVKRMAETNVVIKTLLDHNGHPDKWPFQLREDLFRRMGLEQKKVYAPIKGIGKDGW